MGNYSSSVDINYNTVGIVIGLIIALVVILLIFKLVSEIKRSVTRTLNSQMMRAAKTILNSLNDNPTGVPPYSVPGLTSLYRPKFERDFPEMRYERLESMARNGMIAILNAMESKKPDSVENSSRNLQNQMKVIIEDYSSRGENINYDNVQIHAISMTNYNSTQSTATAVFRISLQSLAYRTKNGAVVNGSDKVPRQNLFSLTLMHNQTGDSGSGHYFEANCPNCGAPIEDLSHRNCSYCGSGLVPVVDKIWQIDSFELLK